jgi:hypothetical protein
MPIDRVRAATGRTFVFAVVGAVAAAGAYLAIIIFGSDSELNPIFTAIAAGGLLLGSAVWGLLAAAASIAVESLALRLRMSGGLAVVARCVGAVAGALTGLLAFRTIFSGPLAIAIVSALAVLLVVVLPLATRRSRSTAKRAISPT